MKEYTIDATGKKLGRISSEAANLLLGKKELDAPAHVVANIRVTITNSNALDLSEKKLNDTIHARYSGYPGGYKTETSGQVIAKKGTKELIRRAVNGMLPKNRLRDDRLKRLIIEE
jgi:large subunit ribosomal protein L13